MNYNLKGTNLGLTDEIRDYLGKRLGQLDKFMATSGPELAQVELEYLPSEAKNYRAEVTYYEPGLPASLRAEARGSSLHEAIDIMAGALAEEMSRGKKKRLQIFRRTAVKVKEFIRGWRSKV